MRLWHRKSKWERRADRLTSSPAVRSGMSAVVGLVSLSAVSSAVSAWREKRDR